MSKADVQAWQRAIGVTDDGDFGPGTLAKSLALLPVPAITDHVLKDGAFFTVLRNQYGALQLPQIEGFEALLKAMAHWSLYDAAYGLATAFWETNRTMQPVKEAYWLSEDWRKKNLRYYPWYGRGYVQTTWEANYLRTDKELNLSGSLMANPDRLLEPAIAAPAMVRGMEEGWYTGKKNSDYTGRDYVARRKMINGTDKDDEIASVANVMEAALTAGGW